MIDLFSLTLPFLSALASAIAVFQFTTGFGNMFEILAATTFMAGRDRSIDEKYFNLSDYDASPLPPDVAKSLNPNSQGNDTYLGIETKLNRRFVVVIYKQGEVFRRRRILRTPDSWDQWDFDTESNIFAFAEFTKFESTKLEARRPITCLLHLFDFNGKFRRTIKLVKDGRVGIFDTTEVYHDEFPHADFGIRNRKLAIPYVGDPDHKNNWNSGKVYVEGLNARIYSDGHWYGCVLVEFNDDLSVQCVGTSPSQSLEDALDF